MCPHARTGEERLDGPVLAVQAPRESFALRNHGPRLYRWRLPPLCFVCFLLLSFLCFLSCLSLSCLPWAAVPSWTAGPRTVSAERSVLPTATGRWPFPGILTTPGLANALMPRASVNFSRLLLSKFIFQSCLRFGSWRLRLFVTSNVISVFVNHCGDA